MDEKRDELQSDDRRAPHPPKKRYTTPVVTEYGNVAKLTQGGGGSITDFGPVKKTCL